MSAKAMEIFLTSLETSPSHATAPSINLSELFLQLDTPNQDLIIEIILDSENKDWVYHFDRILITRTPDFDDFLDSNFLKAFPEQKFVSRYLM
jgi:hypothetical protein